MNSHSRRVCVHCGDVIPDHVRGLYCQKHGGKPFVTAPVVQSIDRQEVT